MATLTLLSFHVNSPLLEIYYRLQQSLGQGNIFSRVCRQSFCLPRDRGGMVGRGEVCVAGGVHGGGGHDWQGRHVWGGTCVAGVVACVVGVCVPGRGIRGGGIRGGECALQGVRVVGAVCCRRRGC